MIYIDDTHRIILDSSKQNLILEKLENVEEKKTKNIKQEWQLQGYHGLSLSSVLIQYKKLALTGDDKLDVIEKVLTKLDEIDRTIKELCKRDDLKQLVECNE